MTSIIEMFKQDPYFDAPNCESGFINIDTGLCVPLGVDIFNLPECSTGVYDEAYNCQPIGSVGENWDDLIFCIDTFENESMISGCYTAAQFPLSARVQPPEATVAPAEAPAASQVVATVAQPTPVLPDTVSGESVTTMVTEPTTLTLPETGAGDVAMVGLPIAMALIVAGSFLRRIATGGTHG